MTLLVLAIAVLLGLVILALGIYVGTRVHDPWEKLVEAEKEYEKHKS